MWNDKNRVESFIWTVHAPTSTFIWEFHRGTEPPTWSANVFVKEALVNPIRMVRQSGKLIDVIKPGTDDYSFDAFTLPASWPLKTIGGIHGRELSPFAPSLRVENISALTKTKCRGIWFCQRKIKHKDSKLALDQVEQATRIWSSRVHQLTFSG